MTEVGVVLWHGQYQNDADERKETMRRIRDSVFLRNVRIEGEPADWRLVADAKLAEPLIVYGAAYQDPYDPWGWAVSKLYANREDAASHVAAECVRNIEAWPYEGDDLDDHHEAADFINDCHKVIEYPVG